MQNSIKVAALAALALGVYACAQETTVSQRELEEQIVQAYVSQNGITTKPTASGLYLDVVKEGTGATPAATDWVLVNYTGTTLDNDYFLSTDTATVQKLDFDVNYFHLVPDYLYMSGSIPQGIREALLTMKEGGKVNIMMPSYIGFGSYGAVKIGQMPLLPNASAPAYRPVKYSIELVKVIPDASVYDSVLVKRYAEKYSGFTPIKDKNNIYLKELVKGSTAAKDTIGNGSTVYVHYAGFFLDVDRNGNFVNKPYCFDTNIDTVADRFAPYKANYSYSSSSGYTKSDTLSVSISSSSTSVVTGFDLALRKMTAGSVAEVVFTSSYGYTSSGNTSTSHKPTIAPYTPLRFLIIVDRVSNPTTTTKSSSSAASPKILISSSGNQPFYKLRKN